MENSSRDGTIRPPLPASCKTCMQVKKQQLELNMEQQSGIKLGKEYVKAVYCNPAYLIYMHSTLCKMPGWKKHKLESSLCLTGININNLRQADDTTLVAESKEELKSFLMKVKEKSEKVGLKLNIQKMKIMASVPSLHGKQMGKQCKQCQTLFWGSKITADGDCSHEIKTHLHLRRKVMTNLDSIFKSRDITLPTKVCLVKAMVFPVVMDGCESWTIKKAKRRIIDVF